MSDNMNELSTPQSESVAEKAIHKFKVIWGDSVHVPDLDAMIESVRAAEQAVWEQEKEWLNNELMKYQSSPEYDNGLHDGYEGAAQVIRGREQLLTDALNNLTKAGEVVFRHGDLLINLVQSGYVQRGQIEVAASDLSDALVKMLELHYPLSSTVVADTTPSQSVMDIVNQIISTAPKEEPEWYEGDNHGDTRINAADRAEWAIARQLQAALKLQAPNTSAVARYKPDVILQAICDPENQPHQWMGGPKSLSEALGTVSASPWIPENNED